MRHPEQGLTVLEILIASLLFLLATLSAVSIHHKHREVGAVRECEVRRWDWLKVAQEIEWNARKWEWIGGACLQAGFTPLEPGPTAFSTRLRYPDTSVPTLQPTMSAAQFQIASAVEFATGREMLICGEDFFYQGTIRKIELGTKNNASVQAEVANQDNVLRPIADGTPVLVLSSSVYRTEPSGKPPEQILYEERSNESKSPVLAGFERFKLEGSQDPERHNMNVTLEIGSEGCGLKREFPVEGSSLGLMTGRWWLRGEDLVYEPWVVASK